MGEAQHGELMAVIVLAAQTNALAAAMQVETDSAFSEAGRGARADQALGPR